MLLFCHAPDAARAAREAILHALQTGMLDENQVRHSIQRVQKAKSQFVATQL
jgi:hypothetical protein